MFAEEAGIIIEIEDKDVEDIITTFSEADIFAVDIGFATGETGPSAMVQSFTIRTETQILKFN